MPDVDRDASPVKPVGTAPLDWRDDLLPLLFLRREGMTRRQRAALHRAAHAVEVEGQNRPALRDENALMPLVHRAIGCQVPWCACQRGPAG